MARSIKEALENAAWKKLMSLPVVELNEITEEEYLEQLEEEREAKYQDWYEYDRAEDQAY
tara:strand:+ start:75 stop:254 length:180 start_codon:yes stop_codon:yes gene_type:complete